MQVVEADDVKRFRRSKGSLFADTSNDGKNTAANEALQDEGKCGKILFLLRR